MSPCYFPGFSSKISDLLYLDEDYFLDMYAITVVDFSHNRLRRLPSSLGLCSETVQAVGMEGNPFEVVFRGLAEPFLAKRWEMRKGGSRGRDSFEIDDENGGEFTFLFFFFWRF